MKGDVPISFLIARKLPHWRGVGFIWQVWTGEVSNDGIPVASFEWHEGRFFTDYDAALQCAVTHRAIPHRESRGE